MQRRSRRFGLARVHSALEGRPSYPPLMMVKVLLLEQWYNLSDPQMEEALQDRISFRRFVGLGLQDDTPDYSTISRFRATLEELGISETLFKELEVQLDERGLVLKEGTLMDATLEAMRRPSNGAKSPADRCGLDQDPPWEAVRLQGASGCGRRHGAAEGALTPAKVYESEVADGLVSGDDSGVRGPRL